MSALSDSTNNLYSIYVQNNVKLAQSIVIKFDQVAQATNLLVLQKTGVLVDQSDRTQWKYYQNISGEYNFSDSPMEVYSLDSENLIPFTVQALAENPVTAQAYSYGTIYYNELLASYPGQEMLILGILYPCDKTQAIAAVDGTILSYPGFLVEDAEVDLIAVLQKWIYAYEKRWIVPQFALTDDLYNATCLAQLYLNLVGMIANIRLAACKTNQAHSFHIKQYLRSHGFLDTYINSLTQKQILNMYRNINYYERYAGYQSTFDKLVEVLFTYAGFPAYRYVMEHDTAALRHVDIVGNSNLLPTPMFKRLALNEYAQQNRVPDYTLSEVMALMSSSTPNNEEYQNLHFTEIQKELDLSKNAKLETKLVEVMLNPLSSTVANVPESLLFNQWVVFTANDKYAVPVEYTPIGSIHSVRLTHQQALALWIYATTMALRPQNTPFDYQPLQRVPSIKASRVVIDPKPPKSIIAAMTDPLYVTSDLIDLMYSTAYDVPANIPSLNMFTKTCQDIYMAMKEQKLVYSFQEEPNARGMLEGAAHRFYTDTVVELNSLKDPIDSSQGMLYSKMLEQLGLNLTSYQSSDYYNMALNLYQSATGSGMNIAVNPTNVQAAMISLMSYLSSYSVQFVSSGVSDQITDASHADLRISNMQLVESEDIQEEMRFVRVRNDDYEENFTSIEALSAQITDRTAQFQDNPNIFMDFSLSDNSEYVQTNGLMAKLKLGVRVSSNFDQQSLFQALSPLQRMNIVDVYRKND